MTEPTDSKAALIEAAMRLFAERGYEATTTRDIVRAAGVNISLIAYYFGGKEGLIEACLAKIAKQFQKREGMEPAKDFSDFYAQLQRIVTNFLTSHMADPVMHQVVQREIDRDSLGFRRSMRETYLENFKRLVNFFRHGQKHGWVATHFDPVTLAITLHGAMLQHVRIDHVRRELNGIGLTDANHLNSVADTIMCIFKAGIGEQNGNVTAS